MSRLVQTAEGNSKLGDIPCFSTAPIKNCKPGVPCAHCGQCYALKAFNQYTRSREAWTNNGNLQRKDAVKFFSYIAGYIQAEKPPYFRPYVAGDIGAGIDPTKDLPAVQRHYDAFIDCLVKTCTNTRFLLYTKYHEINFRRKPDNLSVVLSMWNSYGNTRKRLPRCWMHDPKNPDPRIPSDALKCPGSCSKCHLCWHLDALGCDVVIDKH